MQIDARRGEIRRMCSARAGAGLRVAGRIAALGIVLLAQTVTSWAQTASGRLSGTVLDPSGAAVMGSVVTVRSETQGTVFSVKTDRSGAFLVLGLPAGEYTVQVDLEGFQSKVVRDVKVDIAKETSLPPVRLELGSVTEVIEVKGGVSQVQTTTAELSSTVTMEQIQHLPLIGRGPLALIHLEAGVAFSGRTPTVINGQRTSFSNVTLDGINIQDNYIRDNGLNFIPNRPLVDQVSEFTITTQNGNPAFGGGASQVNFTTPSGTNDFHGNAYWHNRNSQFSANQWFSNKTGTAKPFLNLNQAGASLGGPIVRNRLLFYTNYEAFRQRSQVLANTVIPTAAARQGLFTYRDLASNQVRQINVLAAAGIATDPKADELLAQVPGAENINNLDVGDSDPTLLRNTAGYRFNARDNSNRDAVTNRVDYIHSDRHFLSGTYQYTRDEADRPDVGTGFQTTPVVKEFSHTQLVSAGWNWTPSPRWSNELRGGFNLAPGDFRTEQTLGSPLFDGFSYTNPVVNFEPEGRYANTFNFMDNAAWQAGTHSVRFGGSAQQIDVETFTTQGVVPQFDIGISLVNPIGLDPFQFPGDVSPQDLDAAEGMLASLGGIIGSGGRTFNVTSRDSGFVPDAELRRRYSLNTYALYAQDSWRVRPTLTVSYGLRWEYTGRVDERGGLMLSPVDGPEGIRATLLSNATLDFAGAAAGRPLYRKDLNNFAPNIGIAYDLFGNGRTALRMGYSINFVNDEAILTGENAASSNAGLQTDIGRPDLVTTMSGPLPSFEAPAFRVPRTARDNLAENAFSALFSMDPNIRSPYVQQWTFGIQHALDSSTVFEVRYVGNKGTKLWRGFDLNQVLIRENGFLDDFLRARSNGFLALDSTGSFDPSFNPLIPGSQVLTVFPQLFLGGLLSNTGVRSLIQRGEAGEMGATYYGLGFAQDTDVRFVPNLNTFVADLITNFSNSSYNALQVELRRRAAAGVQFQANYTFGKTLTDSSGTLVRFDPFLDINNPKIGRARADFDINHVFNANFVWPLPLGPGQRWDYAPLRRLMEGWTISSILSWQSGAPLSVLSGRGTLNRRIRSIENTAVTALNKGQLDDIVRFRMTGDGPFLIAEGAINPRDNRGVAGDGEAPFPGQVFAHPGAGELGVLQRRLFNSPSAFGLDLAVDKTMRFRDPHSLLLGVKVANLLNHPVFFSRSHFLDSTQFGRVTGVLIGGRVIEFQLRYGF